MAIYFLSPFYLAKLLYITVLFRSVQRTRASLTRWGQLLLMVQFQAGAIQEQGSVCAVLLGLLAMRLQLYLSVYYNPQALLQVCEQQQKPMSPHVRQADNMIQAILAKLYSLIFIFNYVLSIIFTCRKQCRTDAHCTGPEANRCEGGICVCGDDDNNNGGTGAACAAATPMCYDMVNQATPTKTEGLVSATCQVNIITSHKLQMIFI